MKQRGMRETRPRISLPLHPGYRRSSVTGITQRVRIAAAVGAALPGADGEKKVTIVIAGDGALLMNGSEINTIVEQQLPVLIVVLNNAAHGMCITRQALYFAGRYEAVDYPETDAARFAESLAGTSGIRAKRVQSIAELQRTFTEYLATGKPAVIDVPVLKSEVPPFGPFLQEFDTKSG